MNFSFDNDSSKGSSNSNTCNILSSFTLSCNSHLWSLLFDWNDLILSLFILKYSWWYKIQKPRETRKVMLKTQFSFISQKELFVSMQSQLFLSKQVISARRPLSSVKVTSKNLSLVSCLMKSNFCWQSAEIQLPYHLGSIYVKWLALMRLF